MFFKCDFSEIVRLSQLRWFSIDRRPKKWDDELQFAVRNWNTKSGQHQVFRMVSCVAIYCIWKERNSIRFQYVKQEPEVVVKQVRPVDLLYPRLSFQEVVR